ncbi:hypothetical protein MMC30_004118 [Trapelia coarctata]|nr:hypothetical protein [Trapelia coarctata]
MRLPALLALTILTNPLLATATRTNNHSPPAAAAAAAATLPVPNTASVILGNCKIVADPKAQNRHSPIECRESGATCIEDTTGACSQHILHNGTPVRQTWWRATRRGLVKCRGCMCRLTMWYERDPQTSPPRWTTVVGSALTDADFAQALLEAELSSQSSSNVDLSEI